jgi:hypothetical protein
LEAPDIVRRKLIVTLGLMGTGSAFGAVLGAVSLWIVTAIFGLGPNLASEAALLREGAKAGALTGAILAPISAWSLMRFVPLWRAIAEPALGTALGALAGAVAASVLNGGLAWSILGAPVGFLVAAMRLRMTYGAGLRPKESVAVLSEV